MTAVNALDPLPSTQPSDFRWGAGASPSERLFADGSAFSFYQAVRILSTLSANNSSPSARDSLPVRFRSRMGFDFPGTDLQQVTPSSDKDPLPQLLVNFLGLAGAHGPLPAVFTDSLLWRGENALRDFLDIFNHRLILLVYRVHEMHHPELTCTSPSDGQAANHLYALIGMGRDPDSTARNRLAVPDRALLGYSGLLTARPRSASGLERLLSDYFQIEAVVEEFTGAWLTLSHDQWTQIGIYEGLNHRLGDGAILGKRVWDQHAGVTIHLQSLDLSTFKSFLPSGTAYQKLCDLTRFFLGDEFDFTFKLELRNDQIPRTMLSSDSTAHRSELGRLVWLISDKKSTSASTPNRSARVGGR